MSKIVRNGCLCLMMAALLPCLGPAAQAAQVRYAHARPKSISLPGMFAGLANPADGSVYTGDPFGLGEAFAFPVIADTGASGHTISALIADLLTLPETGETYDDEGIGGIETFDVSPPTELLVAPVSIGELQSEDISLYTNVGQYKLQIRQTDPVVQGVDIALQIVGTPLLNQHVMHVRPNSIPFTSFLPLLDHMETHLLTSLPTLPADALKVPLQYRDFVDQSTGPAPVSVSTNPVIPGVRVVDSRRAAGEQSAPTDWLFDTGGAVSIAGRALAEAIGIDLLTEVPVADVEVFGVGGDPRTFFGYRVDELILPLDNGDELVFEDFVVFVPDEGALPAELPGILGMNALGQSFAEQDALGLPLDITESPFSDWYVDALASQLVLVDSRLVPEPSSLGMLIVGTLVLMVFLRARYRQAVRM